MKKLEAINRDWETGNIGRMGTWYGNYELALKRSREQCGRLVATLSLHRV